MTGDQKVLDMVQMLSGQYTILDHHFGVLLSAGPCIVDMLGIQHIVSRIS